MSLQQQLTQIAVVFPPIPRATALAEAAAFGKPLALCPIKAPHILKLFDELALNIETLP